MNPFQLFCAVIIAGCLTSQAAADFTDTEAAVALVSSVRGVGAGFQTRGYTFTLDVPRTATHLGMFNYNGEGEATFDRQIGIWDDAGSLVADLTIPAGSSGSGILDRFIYGELAAPVPLQADELYTVGVWYSEDSSPGLAYGFAEINTIDGFHYVNTAETGTPGGAFAKPTIIRENLLNGYFGPNLRFSTVELPDCHPNGTREDIVSLVKNYGTAIGATAGDCDGDGTVDLQDLASLQAYLAGTISESPVAVPEPSTAGLLLVATIVMGIRHRRRRP